VLLSPYWVTETPLSWAAYCRLMGWETPPVGHPAEHLEQGGDRNDGRFYLHEANKIRLQYCEDHTTRARGWHFHYPPAGDAGGQAGDPYRQPPPRTDPQAPWEYEAKPMVAVAWQEARELADRLSAGAVRYSLPTEAQWEKAARGGLIGARHAWGDENPAPDRCDFDRFGEFSILPVKTFPPNGYGLYAVNGCVWEWTRDWYDAEYYRHSPDTDPEGPATGEEKVLRGGSWADCRDVVTVSFRTSRRSRGWREREWGDQLAPNLGFRLCRTVAAPR
jgi:formylglycine-generating enzyme required for sulfatase activity